MVGFALAGLVFIHRMSDTAIVEPSTTRPEAPDLPDDCLVYYLHGPYFFGAAARLGAVMDQIAEQPRAFVVDLTDVPYIDSSGARAFELLARKTARKGGTLLLTGARPEVRRSLQAAGVKEPASRFLADLSAVQKTLPALAVTHH